MLSSRQPTFTKCVIANRIENHTAALSDKTKRTHRIAEIIERTARHDCIKINYRNGLVRFGIKQYIADLGIPMYRTERQCSVCEGVADHTCFTFHGVDLMQQGGDLTRLRVYSRFGMLCQSCQMGTGIVKIRPERCQLCDVKIRKTMQKLAKCPSRFKGRRGIRTVLKCNPFKIRMHTPRKALCIAYKVTAVPCGQTHRETHGSVIFCQMIGNAPQISHMRVRIGKSRFAELLQYILFGVTIFPAQEKGLIHTAGAQRCTGNRSTLGQKLSRNLQDHASAPQRAFSSPLQPS